MAHFDKVAPLRLISQTLLLALIVLLKPTEGRSQIPPGEEWRTLETEHLRITYPSQLGEVARRAGEQGERAWAALSEMFIESPSGKADLLITDHTDFSNGYARVFPSNRIVVYAPPPLDGFGLPHMDDWMELVVTHELVHIFHEDFTSQPGGTLRSLFGRVPLEWPFFPGAATPGWVLEGIATYYESELTQAGRVRGSFHEMVVRTAVLEDRFERIDQTSGDSPVWPGGQRYYAYGSLFMKYLMDRFGQEAMGSFVRAVAGQWVPYRLNDAAEEAFGVSFSAAWQEWKAELEQRYDSLRTDLERRAPLTEGEALTQGGYYAWSPEPSPRGKRLAFARVDGRSDPRIRIKDLETGEEAGQVRTNNLSQFSWTPAGNILFSQTRYTDSYRIRGDLHLSDSTGETTRLTHGQRLDHPDLSPDGNRIAAVQEGRGGNRLVMVDPGNGRVEALTDFADDELWAYPRWSPDGRWLAVSRWRPGAHYDVVILDPSGELLWEVTDDRAIDNAPAWSPDSRWLLWSSDRSGIPNLYAVELDPESAEPGRVRQVTNLLGGGAYPSVDSGGRWIYFSSYHAEGWRIERIPFDPGSWFQPHPLHSRFLPDPGLAEYGSRYRDGAAVADSPYDPLPTLRPTFWAPAYREGESATGVEVLRPGYGVFTSGEDLVGRHAYSVSATYSGGFGALNGRASYSYGGLENPILRASLTQTHDAAPRPLAGVTAENDTVPLFLVERERALGLSAQLFRTRSRSQGALTLSASHIWEDRFLLEENLKESRRFRLSRSDLRSAEGRATLTYGTARSFPFSISPEDGIGILVRGRLRRDLTVPDSLRGMDVSDRSFSDIVGYASAYKSFRGPGFGNHVLGVRFSGGVGAGTGADLFHYEVGGASGANVPVEFLDIGQGFLFPLRGYGAGARTGRYAWSATAEYRFPISLVNWGPGLFPLHLDWVGGTVFFDAGNAWGPDLDSRGRMNPRRDALSSWGVELVVRTLPLWFRTLDLRGGMAFPLRDADSSQIYLRLGLSF